MTAYFVYVTAADAVEASRIAGAVVQERLAACANLLTGMRSIYRWQGGIAEDEEAVLILKTREALVEPLIARVTALHSYDCPCVVAWPLHAGNPPFLRWIAEETGAGADQGPVEA